MSDHCPHCGTRTEPARTAHDGVRVVADYLCPTCGTDWATDWWGR